MEKQELKSHLVSRLLEHFVNNLIIKKEGLMFSHIKVMVAMNQLEKVISEDTNIDNINFDDFNYGPTTIKDTDEIVTLFSDWYYLK